MKKTLLIAISVILVGFAAFVFRDFSRFKEVARAVSALPWQDGGTITLVREPCVLDTPANAPTTCGVSCPLVSAVYGSACVNFIELDVVSQLGTNFIAAPIEFAYRGGGVHPAAGMQYMAGGASPAIPWVIGIPGVAYEKTTRLAQATDYIIAVIKKIINN